MCARKVLGLCFLWSGVWGVSCQGCEVETLHQPIRSVFVENFDRARLGAEWSSEMSGRWQVVYNPKTKQGRLCVERAKNNPMFLRRALPRDVMVEFDAYAQEHDGDVKAELFTDGRFHATGYVLAHGGWHNRRSIIDRLNEHSRNCRASEMGRFVHCRRVTTRRRVVRGQKVHWKIVRRGRVLRWYLDDSLFLSYFDPKPLEGSGHRFFAFSNWVARVCFDNLRITSLTDSNSGSKSISTSAGSRLPRIGDVSSSSSRSTPSEPPRLRRALPQDPAKKMPARTPTNAQLPSVLASPSSTPHVITPNKLMRLNRSLHPKARLPNSVLRLRPLPRRPNPSPTGRP
ncbi:MAG: hypothetical protein AAGJ35_05010 [Myxococcota bacterium]